LGVFKPVGHTVIADPHTSDANAGVAAQTASPLAGFGYEAMNRIS
jgi:hypothetical protein